MNAPRDEEWSFLRSLADSPGDDTIRRVYADWLQEHGNEEIAKDIRAWVEGKLSKRGFRRLLYAYATKESNVGRPVGNERTVILIRRASGHPLGHYWVYLNQGMWMGFMPLFNRPEQP